MDFSLLFQDVPTLVGVIILVPAVLAAYIVGGEFLVRRLPDEQRPKVRPWIWVGPALIFVTAFLVAPAIGTVITSFQSRDGSFVAFQNYANQLVDFPGGGVVSGTCCVPSAFMTQSAEEPEPLLARVKTILDWSGDQAGVPS